MGYLTELDCAGIITFHIIYIHPIIYNHENIYEVIIKEIDLQRGLLHCQYVLEQWSSAPAISS